MTRVAIKNAHLVSLIPEPTVQLGGVVIEDGHITEVGPHCCPAGAVDARGAVVLPGLVNAHTHVYSALACGMPAPAKTPTHFLEILEEVWWKLDRALDHEAVRLSALVGGLEAVRSGVTAIIDHHASPNAIEGSLGRVAAGLSQAGVRGVLCYEVTDRGGEEKARAGVAENVRFAREWNTDGERSFAGLMGGHAAFTLSDKTLMQIAAAPGPGFHIHVAEDKADVVDSDPIARFDKAGLLSADTIIAHGVHLSAAQLAVAAERGCWLVHNPRSNMNNQVGYAALASTYENVALGTDGIGADMLSEARFAFFKARDAHIEDAWGFPLRLVQGSFRLASKYLGRRMGELAVGAAGDLILTDYIPMTPLNSGNVLGHLLFGLDRANIAEVYASGLRVWPTPLDVVDIGRQTRAAAEKLWRTMGELDG